jgi:hypothetical protein
MFILMILYDFCLLFARFCYIIVYIGNVESRPVGPRYRALGRTLQKTTRCLEMAQEFLYCGLLIRGCGAVFTQPLPSNGYLFP